FAARAPGRIAVDYRTMGDGWSLSVTDNGVGMPPNRTEATAGLGTSIIEALARQLRARVEISATRPGTQVSIVHDRTATRAADAARPLRSRAAGRGGPVQRRGRDRAGGRFRLPQRRLQGRSHRALQGVPEGGRPRDLRDPPGPRVRAAAAAGVVTRRLFSLS